MPLSDHEQRLLEQIERALYAEDPKFASAVRSSDLRSHQLKRVRRGLVVLVLGLATLLVGVTQRSSTLQAVIGVAGFLLMLGAALVIGRAVQRISRPELSRVDGTAKRRTRSRRKSDRSGGGPFARLEERWKRRWEERDGDR